MKPSAITLHRLSQRLELHFNGCVYFLSAEYLRVFSPSAEVQGHGPQQQVLQFGKQRVQMTALHPQGHYALRILFDDGHDSGLYTWPYLLDLAENAHRNWAQYEAQLQAAGKSRHPEESVIRLIS